MSPGDGEVPEPRGGGIQGLGGSHCGGSESWSGHPIAVLTPVAPGWGWTRGIQGIISAMGTQGGFEVSHQIMCFIDCNFPFETHW